MNNKKVSILIENYIPQYIRQNYPNFVEFLKLYYEKQDLVGSPQEFISNITKYLDVDSTSLEYMENFSGMFLDSMPVDILADVNKKTLIKHIREFYESLGSEKSFKFLFRILFNEDVEIYYPTVDILRGSDGKWQTDICIKVTNTLEDERIVGLEGAEIVGKTSGARALVERVVVSTSSSGLKFSTLYISELDKLNPITNFEPYEQITGTTLDGEITFTETIYYLMSGISFETVASDVLISGEKAVLSGQDLIFSAVGSSALYTRPGDIVTVESTIGSDGRLAVDSIYRGSIENLEIVHPGVGYQVGELIIFEDSFGASSAKAKITGIDSDGGIASIKVIDKGHDYATMPRYTINTERGVHAILFPVSTSIGKIQKFQLLNHGINFDQSDENYQGNLSFYGTMWVYNRGDYDYLRNSEGDFILTPDGSIIVTNYDSYNDNYKKSDILEGSISGAKARIIRMDINTGLITYESLGEIDFQENEFITGNISQANSHQIYKLWNSTGTVIPGALGMFPGYYRNTDGFLSSDKKLQDSYYYQDFSYEISTFQPREKWINHVKNLIHPAGTIVFGLGSGASNLLTHITQNDFISPNFLTAAFYKTKWKQPLRGHNEVSPFYNTTDTDLLKFGVSAGTIYTKKKTNLCFGAKMIFDKFSDTEFCLAIDDTNDLLIDSGGNFLET